MMFVSRNKERLTFLFTLVMAILTVAIGGCQVRLISDYDAVIDRSATELQKKVETFLVKMEGAAGTSAGEYANNKAFYDETVVALSAMRVRAAAMPKNELTVESIDLIKENIENLRKLHKRRGERGLSKTVIDPVRTAMNTQFTAILKLELAKKRGG
ncbi:MAG: hypothetical protein ACE5G5_02280 [Candidatus Methylomirabilales bacterium]